MENVVAGMVAGGCRNSAPDAPCEAVREDEAETPGSGLLDDPELRELLDRWPDLPRPLKDAVLALCRSAAINQ